MAEQKKKKGKIKGYDPSKKTGTIVANKKVYNYYASDLVYEIEVDNLRKDVAVEFIPEEGKSKHFAKSIEISDDASSVRYDLPDKFLYTRELGFDDWQTIEISKETMSCRSAESYADAMNKLVERAKSFKANALIDLDKFQSTKNKEQPYVAKAQLAVVAKQSIKGSHKRSDLIGLNDALGKLKKGSSNNTIVVVSIVMAVVIAGIIGAILILK